MREIGDFWRLCAGRNATFALAVALTACAETEPTRFYVLSGMPPAVSTVSGNPTSGRQGVIGVGPIEIPRYLDRGQIVSFTDPNQLDLAEFDRWGEPLQDNFARVMAENMMTMTSASRVEVYPFPVSWRNPSNRQIVVQLIRFDLRPDGVVDLWGNWQVLDRDGRRILASGTSSATESATRGDFKSVAAAMSRATTTFSRDVANAINALPRPPRDQPSQ